MSENYQLTKQQSYEGEPTNFASEAHRRWVFGLVIFDTIALAILLFLAYDPAASWGAWGTIIVVGLVGIATVDGVILQVLVAGQMALTMDRQESEMRLQRKAAQTTVDLTVEVVKEMETQRLLVSQQIISGRDQVIQMIGQAATMQRQLETMERALMQNDEMFYAANRAYVGIESPGVFDAITGEAGFPASGQFTFVCYVINKGNTPAVWLQNAFRGTFVGRNVPREEWTVPDFNETAPGRPVPQILKDQCSPIGGDRQTVPVADAGAIIRGDLVFIVSTKLTFNCLGVKDETYIVHHLWNHRTNAFAESAVWPPDLSLAEQGTTTHEGG